MEGVIGQVMIDKNGNETRLVHYAYLTGKVLFVRGRRTPQHAVACHAGSPLGGGWQRSGEVLAVNCTRCQKTMAYKLALEELQAKVKVKVK